MSGQKMTGVDVNCALDKAGASPRISGTIAAGALLLSWTLVVTNTWKRTHQSVDPWTIADWLINYQGGFVRRGLFGELLWRVGLDSNGALLVAVITQLFFLTVLYVTAFLLFLKTTRSPSWLMLLLSPAFLLFPVISFQGGLRKEIIVLGTISLLGLTVASRWSQWATLVPLTFYVAGVWSHEAIALALPSIILLLWGARKQQMMSSAFFLTMTVLATVSSATALFLGILFSGSQEHSLIICQSWLDRGANPHMCTGAVGSIGGSLIDAVQQVSLQFPAYFAYLPLALLALIPFVAVKVPRSIWLLVGLNYLLLLPLFLTGIDYGRWIYLATASASIVSLALIGPRKLPEFRVPMAASLLFILMWSLPYTGPVQQEPLYGQLLEVPYHIAARWLSSLLGIGG